MVIVLWLGNGWKVHVLGAKLAGFGWGLLVNSGKTARHLLCVANPPPLLERTRRRFGIVEHFKNGKQLRNLEQVATRWLTRQLQRAWRCAP